MGFGVGSTAAVYKLPTAQMACKSPLSGNLGCVGGNESEAMNVARCKSRFASASHEKNASTLQTCHKLHSVNRPTVAGNIQMSD